MPSKFIPGPAYRVRVGDYLCIQLTSCVRTSGTTFVIISKARVIYDDGTEDEFNFGETTTTTFASGNTFQGVIQADHPVGKDGWLVEWNASTAGRSAVVTNYAIWAAGTIAVDALGSFSYQLCWRGPLQQLSFPSLGTIITESQDRWPTWVFQGTVAEDATAGTHVCTLTVSPGNGGAMLFLYGKIVTGATATAQTTSVFIDDGTNVLTTIEYPVADTVSGDDSSFPFTGINPVTNVSQPFNATFPVYISGAMRLILKVSTAAVSVTQTFAVACRISPRSIPTATLLDTVGTSTNTTNTNAIFG